MSALNNGLTVVVAVGVAAVAVTFAVFVLDEALTLVLRRVAERRRRRR